jgi:ParB family chromosome partitioning protein
MKRSGLGRGLGALIPDLEEGTEGTPIQIPLDAITSNPYQPRRILDEEKLDELAASLREHGLIQPVVVRPSPEGYQLVAGERRWRAAYRAGFTTIPALIRPCSDREMLEIALIENMQREDLNAIEAAEAYQMALSEFHMTQEELARRIGKSRAAIANTLRLLNLEEEIRQAIGEGRISEGHGRALLGVQDGRTRLRLMKRIEREGLTVREVEYLVQQSLEGGKSQVRKSRSHPINPHLQEIADQLSRQWGTRVWLKPRRMGGGTIMIAYHSEEDLERILEHWR